jgi:uncharacterized protein (DUF2461 family)
LTFQGFDRKAVELLRTLPGLSAEAYAAQRELLTEGLLKPGAELIETLAKHLDVAGTGTGTAAMRCSVSPLHTDLRFAPAGSPRYKEHLLLTAWHGPDKKTGVTLWVRIDADTVGFASGVGFTPEARDRWRRGVASEAGQVLVEALNQLEEAHRDHRFELLGELLKRPPPPWDEQHPRAALLRRAAFQLRFREALPGELVARPELAAWCAQRLEKLLPVHRWLAFFARGQLTRRRATSACRPRARLEPLVPRDLASRGDCANRGCGCR